MQNIRVGMLIMLAFCLSQHDVEARSCHKKKSSHEHVEVYDYVIVGAGNVGCVMANRLSENGKYSVCVLESGRDDARLPLSEQRLPEKSPAPVPQPFQYNWQQYIRGGPLLYGQLNNRGFCEQQFFEQYTTDPQSHIINYSRASTWGGCTSHNIGASTRQSPFNWDEWVALGLNEWNAENMIQWYKKAQNRSQIAGPDFGGPYPYYSPSIPVGIMGNFDSNTDGYNGKVATLWSDAIPANPTFAAALQTAVLDLPFNYFNPNAPSLIGPNLMDIGTQDRSIFAQGGLGATELTVYDQQGQITLPDTNNQVTVAELNKKLYGDSGFVYPQELAPYGMVGLAPFERVSAANTYLYAALNRSNLTVKSEVLASKILLKKSKNHGLKAVGIEYLEGWNIYQTGRNPNVLMCGYGGTAGDARANAMEAKKQGYKRVYARKEVILSAGVFGTPQLMMLSGLGPVKDLEAIGIRCLKNIPGVGQNLQDNVELFMTFQLGEEAPNGFASFTLLAKSTLDRPYPDFEVIVGTGAQASIMETADSTVQYGWQRLRANDGTGTVVLFNGNNSNDKLIDFSPTSGVGNGPNGPQKMYEAGTASQSGKTVTGSDTNFASILAPGTPLPATVTNTYILFANGELETVQTIESDTSLVVNASQTLSDQPYTLYYGIGFVPTYYNPSTLFTILIEKETGASAKGTVKLQSKDPTVPPVIVYNANGDTQDVQDLYNVMYNNVLPILLSLQNSNPELNFFGNLVDPMPTDILKVGNTTFTSMDQIDPDRLMNWITSRAGGHHAAATMKMGLASDPLAVCDPHGRVYGIEHLRVADISVCPIAIRWPNFNLYAIGEQLASFALKEDR